MLKILKCLKPNPFKMFTSTMNVDSKWQILIWNITFHILKKVLILSPIGWFFLSLFPIGQHLHFSFRIQIAENTPTYRFTIHIMKVLRQSPMCIHDVVGKSVVYYHIMKTHSSLLSAFMKKLAGLCRHYECGIIKWECA